MLEMLMLAMGAAFGFILPLKPILGLRRRFDQLKSAACDSVIIRGEKTVGPQRATLQLSQGCFEGLVRIDRGVHRLHASTSPRGCRLFTTLNTLQVPVDRQSSNERRAGAGGSSKRAHSEVRPSLTLHRTRRAMARSIGCNSTAYGKGLMRPSSHAAPSSHTVPWSHPLPPALGCLSDAHWRLPCVYCRAAACTPSRVHQPMHASPEAQLACAFTRAVAAAASLP